MHECYFIDKDCRKIYNESILSHIGLAKDLIDEDKVSTGGIGGLIDTILKKKPINKNTIDLVSHLLDFIREKLFN